MELHADRRLFHADARQRARILDAADRVANKGVRNPGDGRDVARPYSLRVDTLESVVRKKLVERRLTDNLALLNQRNLRSLHQLAGEDLADCDATDIVAVVEVGHKKLQWRIGI